MKSPNENNLQQKFRFISYVVDEWPRVASTASKRIRAKCFSQNSQVPAWALAYEERARVAAVAALERYETANQCDWPWIGHYCIAVRIWRPYNTAAEMNEILNCINRANIDLFYGADRNTREITSIVQMDARNPRVEVFIYRSILPLEKIYHAA